MRCRLRSQRSDTTAFPLESLPASSVTLGEPSAQGQIFLGDQAFLERMQALGARPRAANVPRAQRAPARPSRERILRVVGDAYDVAAEQMLQRSSGRAFRVGCICFAESATFPWQRPRSLLASLVLAYSQIQAELEATEYDQRMAAVLGTIR
jgi:hypothetical protein